MDFFNKLGNSVTGASNSLSQMAKGISEQSRLNTEIQKYKEERTAAIQRLGEAVYQASVAGKQPQMEEFIKEIQTIEGFINNYTDTLSNIKGVMICESCGLEISSDSQFCPGCGHKVEIKKVFTCPKCHKQLEKGVKFCMSCGTKVG